MRRSITIHLSDKSILICFYTNSWHPDAIRMSTICISEWTLRILLSRCWHNIPPSLSPAVNGAECHGAIPCYLAPCRTRHFRGNLVAMSLRCLANASYIRTKIVLLMRFHIVIRSMITELLFDFRSAHDICQSTCYKYIIINKLMRRQGIIEDILESRRRMFLEIYEKTSVCSYPQEDVAICASGFFLSIIQIEIIRNTYIHTYVHIYIHIVYCKEKFDWHLASWRVQVTAVTLALCD